MIDPRTLYELKQYSGEDRIIDSFEMRDELAELPPAVNVKSGFPTIDKYLEGFESGELIAVSGPRKSGKTLLCQSITYALNEQDQTPLWFSYEVTPTNFFKVFSEKGLPHFALPRKLKQGALWWIEERIAESLVKYGSGVIFIDHLHFLLDLERIKNQSIEIGSLVRKLKMICVEHKVIIFLLCHMVKNLRDDEPGDHDMRDSSFLSQETDTGLVVFRTKQEKDISWVKICYSRRTGVFDEKIKLHKVNGVFVEKPLHEEENYPEASGKDRAAGNIEPPF